MKIFGKDIREILSLLPWPYKIMVTVSAVFLFFVVIWTALVMLGPFSRMKEAEQRAAPLRISGIHHTESALDPSVAYAPDNKTGWLAYTSINPTANTVQVRVAGETRGNCDGWASTPHGIDSKKDDIMAEDGQTVFRNGTWRAETPALVYDPDDKGREWKLFAYKYFWPDNPDRAIEVAQHYGLIVYKYSSDPAKGWSGEQWLFSPGPNYPPPPYEGMILLHLNPLDPSLQNIVTYSRPSALYKEGALVLTLSAFTSGSFADRVVMVTSRDHGNSWVYTGTPFSKADLASIPIPDNEDMRATVLAGATLMEKDGQVYLAAVLGSEGQNGWGTFLFKFEDFTKGILERDAKTGAPVLSSVIPLQGKTGRIGGGTATYSQACTAGILSSEQKGPNPAFQIYKTRVHPE